MVLFKFLPLGQNCVEMPHPSAVFDGQFFVTGIIQDGYFLHIDQALKSRSFRPFPLTHLL